MAAIVLHEDGTKCSERGPDKRCGRKHRVFPDSSRPEAQHSAHLEELTEAVFELANQFGALAEAIEHQAKAIEAKPPQTIEREVVRFVEVERPREEPVVESKPEPKPVALPVEVAERRGLLSRLWRA